MGLQAELDTRRAEWEARVGAETARMIAEDIEALRRTGIVQRAAAAGDVFPDAPGLVDAHGAPFDLGALIARQPAIVTFYRGGWCPYCNMELRAFQAALPAMAAAGAALVAVTMELPDHSLSTVEKNALAFPVLSDPGGALAAALGIRFTLSETVRPFYEKAGHALPTCGISAGSRIGWAPAAPSILPDASRIVAIPGGRARIGTDRPELPQDGEGPAREVVLKPFRLDAMQVTNARFAAFVAETGYRTEAERYGWSYVFHLLLDASLHGLAPQGTPWWRKVDGAFWAAPEGPGSSVEERPDHPAVHVAWNDAVAFAEWAGGRLPTEAEWEHAAQGGTPGARFPWGEAEPNDGTAFCNIWQGDFPRHNTLADGYLGTAPADAFAPNGHGLHNMCGNAWEWCADAFRVRSLTQAAKTRNAAAAKERERVMKGGSYLCHISYCYRYRIAARSGRSPDTSAGHTGFRVAYD
ncbi:SUMF1/EgtB/PvdO family nonheme iron enzyme [Leptolyngbya sp. 15MV]|nr:SUMF1/EgtB/PvdO family nonheme iron enzyme [Leptolyngbya sp. 15MV]